jgi:hypothetical protein
MVYPFFFYWASNTTECVLLRYICNVKIVNNVYICDLKYTKWIIHIKYLPVLLYVPVANVIALGLLRIRLIQI